MTTPSDPQRSNPVAGPAAHLLVIMEREPRPALVGIAAQYVTEETYREDQSRIGPAGREE